MKEVIFHFFPSARFLGLSLKILFHKNKEIERMLLKKTAFSLMSLITIFALAFVAPSAMAAFDVTVTSDDVMEGGGIEIEYSGTAQVIEISFGEVIKPGSFTFADVTVVTIDKNGLPATVTVGTAADPVPAGTPADGKNFMLTLPNALNYDAAEDMAGTLVTKIFVQMDKEKVEKLGDATNMNNAKSETINLVRTEPGTDGATVNPDVVSITRATPISHTGGGTFVEEVVTGAFQVKIVLTEKPHEGLADGDAPDRIAALDVAEGTVTSVVAGVPFMDAPPFNEGGYDNPDGTASNPPMPVPTATGRDRMYYPYLASITPKGTADMVTIKVKGFKDTVKARSVGTNAVMSGEYVTPIDAVLDTQPNGRDRLKVKVVKDPAVALAQGHEVLLTNKRVIPAGGFLIVATDPTMTGINLPKNADADDNTPKGAERSPAELKYNAIKVTLPNLEAFLTNGGTIDLVSPNAGLVISEIMWGSDASLATNSQSQWIEIKNTTAADIKTGDKTHKLIFYGPNETAPAKTAAVAATATTAAVPAALPAGVVDRVGTITELGGYWSLAGKGQSGRTGYGEKKTDLTAVVPTLELISMYRMMVPDTSAGAAAGAMMPAYGNTAAAWMQSTPPAVNQDPAKGGNRIASPGDDRIITAAEAAAIAAAEAAASAATAAAAAAAADAAVSMPLVGQIYISEVMFAGGGTLPQWIEISNGSRSEQVNLSDWTLTVENATADADVSVGSKAVFTIPEGTRIDPSGQHDTTSTILVVTEQGRHNLDAGTGTMGEDQILNLWTAQQTELILLGVTKRRYSLLSDMAFKITLGPPTPKAVTPAATETPAAKATRLAAEALASNARKAATDVVGNLGTAGTATWALPMDEGARSSIIRRHVEVSVGPAEPEAGEMMDSWVLASETSFAQITHVRASSYYGSADDVGTPGFRAGGALPVELSHFRPARDKVTDAVVITWSTQSELNNAGFFIKRSQQRDGEFQIINATMIQGAGTSSEKQFYTYQDTTAQPNVVYYYQIEDVSLDGNRQTLTRGIRLKGHVSVAGKLTTLWGDLKTSQ